MNEIKGTSYKEPTLHEEKVARGGDPKSFSKLEDSLFSPHLFQHYSKIANTLSKSRLIPKELQGKPEDVFLAMEMGHQLGLSVTQALQDIAVINGKPCLWGDGLLALCLNHPDCEDIQETPLEEKGVVIGYKCVVKRRNHSVHTQTFTIKEASKAGLLNRGAVWKAYPERMCQIRARALALRDKFADALRGLRIAEEIRDIPSVDEVKPEVSVQNQRENSQTSLTERIKSVVRESALRETAGESKSNENVENPVEKEEAKSSQVEIPDKINMITPDQIEELKNLMKLNNFTAEREKKAFEYHKITKLEDLTEDKAHVFLLQLRKG